MEVLVSRRDVFDHLTVIEALCKGFSLNYGNSEIIGNITESLNREISELLTSSYFESREVIDTLTDKICTILDDPNSFACLEEVYEIYASLIRSLIEIKHDDYLRNKKGLAVR